MKPVDIFCAILVAVIWGLGFIASRLALDELSPSMMTALRFAIAAVPCLFIRKPKVSWPILIVISLTMFLFQFLAQSYGLALGVPGRRAAWAWLPLPGAPLWIGASGLGCLREWIAPGTEIAGMHQSADCLIFIISFSVPLSALLIVLLRRACPLRPVLTAVLIGLASAAASASLLEICHSFDAAATDLLTHALAVIVVVAVNAAMGGRLLSRA